MKIFTTLLFTIITLDIFGQITWSETTSIAPPSQGKNHPRIVTDGAGNPLVLWNHNANAMFSRWNGSAFETPVILNPTHGTVAGASWMGPDIAAHGDTVYVVYKEIPEHTGHIVILTSFDGGVTFSQPNQVDFLGEDLARFPTVTTDDDGHPIIAFMRFNSSFLDARWVVTRSNDFGLTFTPDVLASGWSSADSDVCDCCPGSITASGEHVFLLYRDNNNNLRDSWAGVSYDNGNTFTEGINIDQHNWMISACPSTGPDGIILGDTMYSTYMNAVSGARVFTNKTPLSSISSSQGILVNGTTAQQQNFSRVSGEGNALGFFWKQISGGEEQAVLKFTSDVRYDPFQIDTVGVSNIENVDIVIHGDKVYTIWEDLTTNTVRFRSGTFELSTSIEDEEMTETIKVFPNPTNDEWVIESDKNISIDDVVMYNQLGVQLHMNSRFEEQRIVIEAAGLIKGLYFLKLKNGGTAQFIKLMRM